MNINPASPACTTCTRQGQSVVASRAIAAATVNGSWVLLQNCHLGLDYMETMEDYVQVFFCKQMGRQNPWPLYAYFCRSTRINKSQKRVLLTTPPGNKLFMSMTERFVQHPLHSTDQRIVCFLELLRALYLYKRLWEGKKIDRRERERELIQLISGMVSSLPLKESALSLY